MNQESTLTREQVPTPRHDLTPTLRKHIHDGRKDARGR
jgi:hypothetical protein